MNTDDFIKKLYQSIVIENGTIYRDLLTNTNLNEVKDPYWKEALNLYLELSNEKKEVFLRIIEQIQVDTISNILGVIDGVVSIAEGEIEIEMTIKGNNELINGDLQELFLEYDEENRK